MYLQRTTGSDEGRGGVYHGKHDHLQSSIIDTMAPTRHACRRSYTPLAASQQLSLVDGVDSHANACSPSRSPPSPITTVLPGKASCGVFLSNCKVSADFIQLRKDSNGSSVSVRLYLTATELVKKSSASIRNGHTPMNSASVAHEASGSLGGRDFTISRYGLQDIEVSRSKVSAETMMVAVARSPENTRQATHSAVYSSLGVTATTTSASRATIKASLTTDGKGAESSTERAPVMSVEAYQLLPGQGSIEDWISHVEQGKRKLTILDKLQKHNSHGTSSAVDLTSQHHHTSPVSKYNSSRPTSIAISSTGGQRKRDEMAHHRNSLSGYDFPSQTPASPTREKFPTTSNGRYTPLHHHYSPHRLFSNSQVHRNSVQLRHMPDKDPFRLFRRFSLGGNSKTYRFPSPPGNSSAKGSTQGDSEGEVVTDSKQRVGGATYMYSLTGHSVEAPENNSLPTPSRTSPSSSPLHKSPLSTRRNGTLSLQSTPQRDVLRRKRRPTLSRSVSEYHTGGSGYEEKAAQTERESSLQPVTMHQMSDPLPCDSSTGNHVDVNRGSVDRDSRESSVPPELRDLQSFLTSLPSSSNDPSTTSSFPASSPLARSSPSPSDNEAEGESTGFQSFLRHKQIRGRKIYVSPRAYSTSISSELLSPPAWVDKFSLPSPNVKPTPRGSATLPRHHKLKNAATGTAKTLDREVHSGSSSPVPSSKSSKTPKIFKRFHRRWQSSSGVKLEQDMIPVTPVATSDLKVPPPPPPAYHTQPQLPEKLHLLPAREVAEGLASMDAELLERISPDEIRDGAWMKRGEKERLAPNVLAMVQSFNQLALLVPTEILDEQTQHQRAKVISAYIQIARKCYFLKNYNSLKAILAGLQSTPVHRLRRTWKYVPSKRRKRFNMLCKLMSEENNWQLYRDELDGCLLSSTPCIPYLGQYLTQVCHQLSYNKMRAEKDEVKLRRRSRSFVGMDSDHKKEAMHLRRRSNSFHRSSLEFGGGNKRSSAASISTPVSPVISEDENESLEHEGVRTGRIMQQIDRTGTEEDAQSLEFSLSLDDRTLDSSVSQPETAVMTPPTAGSDELGSNTARKRLPSQKSIVNFHSTPVKDANGYIRPLCAPFVRELNFGSSPVGQAFDEPDFGGHFGKNRDVNEKEHVKSSDEESAPFRVKIPSISLQRTSSHSSLEDWGEDRATGGTSSDMRQQIRKSRSLESSLSSSLRNGHEGEVARNVLGSNRLTPSHSIPSLDSDSVFSIGEGEGGVGEGERGGERGTREGEGERGARELEKIQRSGNRLVLECSLDSDFAMEDVNSSFSTAEFSLSHNTPNSSTGPIRAAVTAEKNEQQKDKSSPDERTKTHRHSIHRSKSTSGLTNYRHKWRWKKAVALASDKKHPSHLNNADPFDLLSTYQRRSHNCLSTNPSSKVDFRTLLNRFDNNSETRNYELSFEREP